MSGARREGLERLAQFGAAPLGPGDPERVGRYELLGVLGAGGMGRVYLGRAQAQLAAVKVLRAELAEQPQFRRRFARELQAVSRIGAAFTAPLLDARTDAGRPWMATAYIPGVPLAEAATLAEPLPREAVWRLAAGLAVALVAIHQTGLIHRDLKPSNVILALDGPKVIDFGVAHASALSQLTLTGEQVGTPSYMAPEQATTGTVLAASDVFAFGGLLCYAATGAPPFGIGAAAEVLYRVVHQEPDLAGLAARDSELAALAGRCLAKDPAERPDAAGLVAGIVTVRLAADWPEALRSRIVPRAGLAHAMLAESSASTASSTSSAASAPADPDRPI